MADSGSSTNSNNAPLCANDCGFFGNPQNQNLCSVCYAAFLKQSGQDSTSNDAVQSQIGTEIAGVRDEEADVRSEGSPPASESSDASESFADSSFNRSPEFQQIEIQQEIDPKPTMPDSGSSSNGGDAQLCANNCGFFSNPKNRNLCSVCYAAFLMKSVHDSTSNAVVRSQIGTEIGGVRDEEENGRSEGSSSETSESEPKTKNRCRICKKKVGLLGFHCRCGDLFCGSHRYPETHSCDVDHKAISREVLKKQIVECKADKLEFRA